MPKSKSESALAGHKTLDVRSALREGIAHFEAKHISAAPLTAELLLMHTLGRDRTWLYAHPEEPLDERQRERFLFLIAQRASGVPVQHLTGHQEFWGLEFEVTPDVLIPRPETEHLIEVALQRLGISSESSPSQRNAQWHIADVGTGSGCIAIALAHELPQARIIATDISAAALTLARRNAARHAVDRRIEFIECNLLDASLNTLRGGYSETKSAFFDLIVGNPPYIGRNEAATLPVEVANHEPESALYAGETGLELYAPLIEQAAKLILPGGPLVLELGHNSAERVLQLLDTPAWINVLITKDLAGIKRVASAIRTSQPESDVPQTAV